MSPILGIYASQISGHLATGNFYSIATINPAGQSSVSFTSIPQTFTHLQIRVNYFGSDVIIPRINGDTGSNYSAHGWRGTSGALSGWNFYNGSNMQWSTSWVPTSTYAGVVIADFFDYTNTNKYKLSKAITGCDRASTSGGYDVMSGLWRNTSAITSITLPIGSGTYGTNSSISLYGVI